MVLNHNMDRASDYGSEGLGFDFLRVYNYRWGETHAVRLYMYAAVRSRTWQSKCLFYLYIACRVRNPTDFCVIGTL